MQKNISTYKKESFLLSFKKDYKVNKSLYIMFLPVLLYYIIFAYFPMYGVIIAFQDYNPASGILGSDWVGIEHFKDFFTDVYSWRLIRNTLRISFTNIVFGFPAPIILALLINEARNKYNQKCYYKPNNILIQPFISYFPISFWISFFKLSYFKIL